MRPNLPGIHHVTAIAGDPQRNVDFYVGILGLRLVKQTVNFDDPKRYHLYFGDNQGSPGTLLTFFAWPESQRGRQGAGQFSTIALAVPETSLGYWIERLVTHGVAHSHPEKRFGEQVVAFKDPDGLPLEIIASSSAGPGLDGATGTVPSQHAIRKVHSVELWGGDNEDTEAFLTDSLGFHLQGTAGNRSRFAVGDGGPGTFVDLIHASGFWSGSVAVGTIHHVAWRTSDDQEQDAWRSSLSSNGIQVTPVRDRQYFRSIYFNEPGGALFEIATDPPGFAIDEAPDELGTQLKLPPQYEGMRAELEESLIPLHPAGSRRVG
jgi:catechol 2,3-dioxygenase-like lactoylglutathione lyase family enzyme